MTTRLTKAMREEILDSVLVATDFEKKKKDILQRAGQVARKELLKLVPEEFLEMIKNRPQEWFLHDASVELHKDYAPENAFNEIPNYWYGCNLAFEPIPHPCGAAMDIPKERQAKLFTPFRKEADKLRAKQDKLRSDMRAFLLSCSTVEKVLEQMPELKPHIPEKAEFFAPTVNTNNLLSQLMKSGFVVEEVTA